MLNFVMGIAPEGGSSNEHGSEILHVKYDVPFKISPALDNLRILKEHSHQYAGMETPFNLEGMQGAILLETAVDDLDPRDPSISHYPNGFIKLPPVNMYSTGLSISDKAGYRAFPLNIYAKLDTLDKDIGIIIVSPQGQFMSYYPEEAEEEPGVVYYTEWSHLLHGVKQMVINQDSSEFNNLEFMLTRRLPNDVALD